MDGVDTAAASQGIQQCSGGLYLCFQNLPKTKSAV